MRSNTRAWLEPPTIRRTNGSNPAEKVTAAKPLSKTDQVGANSFCWVDSVFSSACTPLARIDTSGREGNDPAPLAKSEIVAVSVGLRLEICTVNESPATVCVTLIEGATDVLYCSIFPPATRI